MYKAVGIFLFIMFLIALSGCSSVPGVNQVKAVVSGYCALPVEHRSINREAVALAVMPNRIEIDCAADSK